MKEKSVDFFTTSEAALEQAELLRTVPQMPVLVGLSHLIRVYQTVPS
jgi:hypothetical protein